MLLKAISVSIANLVLILNLCVAEEQGRWEKYADRYYFFSSAAYEYTPAETVCKVFGGYLVAINSGEENQFLLEQNSEGYRYWIGLKRNGNWSNWVWLDGQAARRTDWADDYPNQDKSNDLVSGKYSYPAYVVSSDFTRNSWQNTYAIAATHRFVCEVTNPCAQCRADEACVRKPPAGFGCVPLPTTTSLPVISTARDDDVSVPRAGDGGDASDDQYRYIVIALSIVIVPCLIAFVIAAIYMIRSFRLSSPKRNSSAMHDDVDTVALPLYADSSLTSSSQTSRGDDTQEMTMLQPDYEPSVITTLSSKQPQNDINAVKHGSRAMSNGHSVHKSTSAASQALLNGTGPVSSVSQYGQMT